jgi:hypothetical protein
MSEARDKLAQMLQVFISGRDRSLHFVNQIESLLLTHPEFHETVLYDDLSVPLSCYRPGGGENLYDEEDLLIACKDALWEMNQGEELRRLDGG